MIKRVLISISIIFANPLFAEEEFSECVIESAVAVQDSPNSVYQTILNIRQEHKNNWVNTNAVSSLNLQQKICTLNSASITAACYEFHQAFLKAISDDPGCIAQLRNLRLFLNEMTELSSENVINYTIMELAIHKSKQILSKRYPCL